MHSRVATLRRWALVLLAVMLFGACGGGGETAPAGTSPEGTSPAPSNTSGEASGLQVRAPLLQWVPGSKMASVYLEVINSGSEADRLTRVETASAAAAETHETLVEGDTVRMEARPDGFEIPATGSLRLEPGGKHIMLIEPTPPPEGQGLTITLHFEKASPVEVVLELSDDTGEGHAGMDHSTMDHGSMDHGSMDHGESAEGDGAEGDSQNAASENDGSAGGQV